MRSRTAKHTCAAVLAALVVAACTAPERAVTSRPPVSEPAATAVVSPRSEPEPEPPVALPDPPREASSLPGTLLVRTLADGLAVVRPDGTRAREIVAGMSEGAQVITAAWAPDGSRIAWSQIRSQGGVLASEIVWSDPDGTHRRNALLPFAAFYLSWDPTSSRVAFLGGQPVITLGVVEESEGRVAGKPLDEGAPFYFSWAPAGDRMVTHIADSSLETLTMDGKVRELESETGSFQAPVWTSDGTTVLYASGDDRLVARDVRSGDVRELADLAAGGAYLVASPDGSRVAFHARPSETDFYDMPSGVTDLGVHVVELDGGAATTVTEAPAMAWSWSPDGDRLAILEPVYGDTVRFRWVVWDGTRTFATEPFVATLSSQQEEMPFFSQFAQSSSMWSPDGGAFAFAAELEDGTPAVWIQPVRRGAAAYPVALGVTVAWAPAA